MKIKVYDEKWDSVVEEFDNPQEMYDVLRRRLDAVKQKRKRDLDKSFNKGYYTGVGIIVITQLVAILLLKMLL